MGCVGSDEKHKKVEKSIDKKDKDETRGTKNTKDEKKAEEL